MVCLRGISKRLWGDDKKEDPAYQSIIRDVLEENPDLFRKSFFVTPDGRRALYCLERNSVGWREYLAGVVFYCREKSGLGNFVYP